MTALPTVDHAVIAHSDIERLVEMFEAAGFTTRYGGVHSNGITHNYTVGFDDGSYIELISTRDPDQTSPWWNDAIHGDAGPCAWALPVEDIETETERLADRGIAVDGPNYYTRERPDGVSVEWDLTVVGERELGATVPFLVRDRTPRDHRVPVADSVADTELVGLSEVIVGVTDPDTVVDRFLSVFESAPLERREQNDFAAELVRFAETPVTLAVPHEDTWLAERLDRFGPLPCAYLLESTDVDASIERFDLSPGKEWFDDEVRWFDIDVAGRLGIVS